MKRIIFIVAGLAAVLSMAAPRAEAAINIIATTSDLAALVTEVGGKGHGRSARARLSGPALRRSEAELRAEVEPADLLVVVGRSSRSAGCRHSSRRAATRRFNRARTAISTRR